MFHIIVSDVQRKDRLCGRIFLSHNPDARIEHGSIVYIRTIEPGGGGVLPIFR